MFTEGCDSHEQTLHIFSFKCAYLSQCGVCWSKKKIVFILSLYFHTMWNYIYSASRCWLGDWKGIWPVEISI